MSGSVYNHLNVMFPAESPPDVGPLLFSFSSSRTDDNHNSICVYIYIIFFCLFRIMSTYNTTTISYWMLITRRQPRNHRGKDSRKAEQERGRGKKERESESE